MQVSQAKEAASEAEEGLQRPYLGAGLMMLGCALLTVNDALMKALVSDIPIGELVAVRALAGLGVTLIASRFLGGPAKLRPQNRRNVMVLTGLLLLTLFLFPVSLRYIPLADAIMLAYLSPVVVAALAPLFLNEQVGWRRWSAVLLGLAGVGLVVNPGSGNSLHWAVVLPISVAVLVGIRDILTRRYIRGESPLALSLMVNLAALAVGGATALGGWVQLNGEQIAMALAAGALMTTAQIMMTTAFLHADAAVLSCLKYTSIIWAAAFGWIFWREGLAPLDWLGALLIALSGVIITLRMKQKPRPTGVVPR